jgi:hypothetical protein
MYKVNIKKNTKQNASSDVNGKSVTMANWTALSSWLKKQKDQQRHRSGEVIPYMTAYRALNHDYYTALAADKCRVSEF